jgi:DNA-binding CsgD family transcriptional regulator
MHGSDGPPFGETECEVLAELVPHLRRILRIYRRFAILDLDRIAALEGLDQISVGVVVARQDGTIICTNRAAEELLHTGDGLTVHDGRLHVQSPVTSQFIHESLALGMPTATETARPIRIAGSGSSGALRMVVAKLPGRHQPHSLALPQSDLVALVFEAAPQPRLSRWEHLQHLFGLLASEAKLVELLANGSSLADAVEQLKLSTGSARQYLKRAFQKTGVHRQSDLVRKVLTSPAWIRYPAR